MTTHAESRERHRQLIEAVRSGIPFNRAVRTSGIERAYARTIVAKAGLSTSDHEAATAYRVGQLIELRSLGKSRRECAALLGIVYPNVVKFAIAHGIQFDYDRAGSWAPVIERSRERAATMAALYRDGFTLAKIGEQYGLSRERVRQLIGKHFRMDGGDGGQHVKADRARQKRHAARDAKALLTKGCTWDQYLVIRDLKWPTRAFRNQWNSAIHRGIGWELTLWQWWTLWQASGHWAERGRGQGYVMCRKGDIGPYAVGNVYFATAAQNSSDGQRKRRLDPSLPTGVSRTKGGRFVAMRHVNGKKLRLGRHDTAELAYAAYLRAAPGEARAA